MESNVHRRAKRCHKPLLMLIAVATYHAALVARAAEPCTPVVAQITSAQGSIEIRRRAEPRWQPASLNDFLCAGDMVRVRERSRAAIALTNDVVLRLDQHTTLTLAGVEEPQPTLLELCTGAIHFFSRYRKTFRVITPFVNAAVEGTEVSLDRADTQDNILVYEGQVFASNEPTRVLPQSCGPLPKPLGPGGTLLLVANEAGVIPADAPPAKRPGVVVRPENAVQWALYYPPVIDYRIEPAAREARVRDSLQLYREGRVAEALSVIAPSAADATVTDSRFFIYRAGLLLSVGRVDEARLDIDRALDLDPRSSGAHALQAIIAVVQNEKDRAFVLASRAVELDPSSAAARIALSYAQQAHFQIEEALASVQRAVEIDPQNALAWARLAELQMSRGYLDRALAAAERAASLNPNIARTQTVLGFAHLTRIDTRAAIAAFTRAIELDQADPLPRLGLGLAKIRESALHDGRREIEIAASLDPADSLIRSYLGKAYFEEKRDELAGTQFDLAKALDPRDPTPWFYDAIRKQTENRPVEALRDLEKSIELNDNRAVYRSSLLLDQDRAARGASLARIYDDLGFERLAVIEASKSLSEDPANHSGHRFLSDAYARLDRHEIARVSELLQAQLLQPININPVQPRLAFTDLNILSSSGLAEAAFNEYSVLFERNRPRLTLSALGGNHSTWGDEAVVSGVNGRVSYSLGQFHYETDGFRTNNDLKHDIFDLFAQVEINPRLNLQAEIRTRDTEHGDLSLNFTPESFTPRDRSSINQDSFRLGGRFSPSPPSNVLASFIRTEREFNGDFFLSDFPDIRQEIESQGDLIEAQYILSLTKSHVITGAGRATVKTDDLAIADFTSLTGLSCPPGLVCQGLLERTTKSSNAYLYLNLALSPDLQATMGLSQGRYEDPSRDLNLRKWNPKLGLRWTPNEQLTVRFAGFKTLKRELITDQTIEPTNIVGFNQFFDDFNGTRTKRLGLGIDFHPIDRVYSGLEISKRDLVVPVGVSFIDQEEKLSNLYVHWNARSDLTITLGYRLDKFTQEVEGITGSPTRLSTETLPMALRYFASDKVFFIVTPTFVRQEVERVTGSAFPSGTENFFVLNAAIGYRIPGRKGTLSLEVNNMFDEEFVFQDDRFRTSEARIPRYTPARDVFLRASLTF